MNLEAFLHDLHFDIDHLYPTNWQVDFEDAPLPYKLYRGLPVVPLSPEVPLTLDLEAQPRADLSNIGHFLWYAYGLTRLSQSLLAMDATDPRAGVTQTFRRFAPSGGGLYPSELYVYLKIKDIPFGIYHYDVAHHRFVLLRAGDFDSYLTRALGHRCDMTACFGAVFVSTMFWKNFYKYNHFSYRLQGLDAGVLMGQVLETAKRFGFTTGVYFQYLDGPVNHLLGVSEREESVYAVMPLSVEPVVSWFAAGKAGRGSVTSAELYRELGTIEHSYYLRSRRVLEYPLVLKMTEASRQDMTESFRQMGPRKPNLRADQTVGLPAVTRLSYDLAAVCQKRYSPGLDFVLDQVTQSQLATLLQEATVSFSYQNDLDGARERPSSRVSLYGCLYGVEGIPDGAYEYDGVAHALRPIRPGDHRTWLQQGMSMQTVNLSQVPLCLHVVGDHDHLSSELGYRGYRIQQMEAGMLLQRILLIATAMNMGGHPLLGFDVNECDEIYKTHADGKTALMQIPVGFFRPNPRLEGRLHG